MSPPARKVGARRLWAAAAATTLSHGTPTVAPAGAMAQTPADPAPVRVAAFRPAAGTVRPGDTAASALVVRSAAATPTRVWVGYSVQAPDGRWLDVEARPEVLPAGAAAEYRHAWRVPAGAAAGAYRVVMALWSAPPGTAAARRLASADRPGAFRVRIGPPRLGDEPYGPWRAADHRLGRGRVRGEEVLLAPGGGYRLRLRAGACDGAELRSAAPFRHGSYTVRLRAPHAPGSLSAVFLYADEGDRSDEIDVELFNDGTRRALLTTWIAGRQRRQAAVRLPFDPAAGTHAYTIRWQATALEFLVDGRRVAAWADGYPKQPMYAMANVWWPAWLACTPPAEDRELTVEAVTLEPVGALRARALAAEPAAEQRP